MNPFARTRPQRRGWIHAAASALLLTIALVFASAPARAEGTRETVRVVKDDSGMRLQVDGRDFLIRGMNWDYIPIGQNYSWDLWQQPEAVIQAALDREAPLLAGMGCNTLRIYAGIPARWVRYLHDRYGIYCIINHTVGRYGYTLDGVWNPSTDYSNPRMRAALEADVAATVKQYKDTPGVLMFLLGNESNYGLSWSSFEIEALPKGEQQVARARFLYSLFDEIAKQTKTADPSVPVAIANGDIQYIDLIAEECKDLDALGVNVYRGVSVGNLFQVVKDKTGLPVFFSEFGCDAFNSKDHREDQAMQAKFLIGQWQEIYQKSAGHGQEGNAIGGCIFQWSDGWWKYKMEERLDIHDTNASWPDGGYTDDFVQGENNMNEEWWGICAKGKPDNKGLFDEYPRAAYYAMRKVWALDPYAPTTSAETIQHHFAGVTAAGAALEARGDHAAMAVSGLEKVHIAGVRAAFETINTGGHLTTTPTAVDSAVAPAFRGYDKFQSFYVDLVADPDPSVEGRVSLNVRGDVPMNAIDQIFYENRNSNKIEVYQSTVSWDARWFDATAFYRTGHYHWGYEGDFFGLYREANYGPNIDIYDAEAPVGVEMGGKRQLGGFKLAWGPQLWWGAPPAAILKYQKHVGRFDGAVVYEKDVNTGSRFSVVGSSFNAIRPTEKVALYLKTARGPLTFEGGGLWAGQSWVGERYPVAVLEDGAWVQKADHIRSGDTYGGKFRVTGMHGRLRWYAQTAAMGLVADGGPQGTTTLTGWSLKDAGVGNQNNVLGGFTWQKGKLEFAPNFLWQKPIEAPIPGEAVIANPVIALRNVMDDPFAVRSNREMTAAEMLVTFDPTPATWLYMWDNDVREDAKLAGNLGFVYRHFPTGQDAAIGFLADGKTPFAFASSTPARDLWELNTRLVSRVSANLRMVLHGYVGTAEPSLADDQRRILRRGVDLKISAAATQLAAYAKFNDWGPYDYHRDFNLTYPVQVMGDLSHTLGTPQWFDTNPQTRIGVRATWRSLDQYSPRYSGLTGDPNGAEWEVRTYLRFAM